MNQFKPHHSCICEGIYTQDGNVLLIPELWINLDDTDVLKEISDKGFAVATDGKTIEKDSELIIKDKHFFDFLKNSNFLSYTIFSNEEYLKDLPVFFQNEWDLEITIDSMNILGWTVNKFIEPALLYGFFPIQPLLMNEKIMGYEILDNNMINKWGLIDTFEDASQIAYKNNVEDLYNETWRPLAVCVDAFTLQKLSCTVR
ncbi:MAG: hypothetical protein WAX77_02860 [Methylococcaceae bacterium]